MSLGAGIAPRIWNSALRTSIAVLTAEANNIDIAMADLLEGADKDAVIAVLAQQIGILLATLPPEASERLLQAWGAASLGVDL